MLFTLSMGISVREIELGELPVATILLLVTVKLWL